jgi:CDP-glycerol glycerophosphotransferase
MPEITFVLAVYDVADYLADCLDSVLAQPGADIEVIAVDDASPDSSAQILDQRAAAEPRLRVLHLDRNAGPGNARNLALDLAAGEYVWFIDSDDLLPPGALAAVAAALDERKPDVLLIDWVTRHPDGRTEPSPGQEVLQAVPPGGCTLASLPELARLTMAPWSRLLRRDFLLGTGARFLGTYIYEDVPVTCTTLAAADVIAALDRVCYCYRRRPEALMATASSRHLAIFAAYAQVFERLPELCRGASEADQRRVRAAIFERAISHYTAALQPGRELVPRAERRRFFARMHEDYLRYRPPGFQPPAGPAGIKFRLVQRGDYRAYQLLGQVNRARVAARPR